MVAVFGSPRWTKTGAVFICDIVIIVLYLTYTHKTYFKPISPLNMTAIDCGALSDRLGQFAEKPAMIAP